MRTVNFRGQPMTLAGQEVRVGDRAPDFRVINNNLEPVTLADYRGKVKVLLSVPSLDTGVCDQETRRFNEEAAGLGEDVVVLAVSMDLPFAQRRWCAAAGVERVETLSDHREASFGRAYGVLMEDLRLLARAVFVVDRDDRVTYVEYVPEVASLPNFEAAVAAARQAAS
ncbi:MAG: thiol peroxidase [Bacillota bacterium]|nr:thiol peroxidase [Bacillota bacterium]REJ37864.1 MAG: thiol peroxidase [Bacillota bacterium]